MYLCHNGKILLCKCIFLIFDDKKRLVLVYVSKLTILA